jgi:hypothetical protein
MAEEAAPEEAPAAPAAPAGPMKVAHTYMGAGKLERAS